MEHKGWTLESGEGHFGTGPFVRATHPDEPDAWTTFWGDPEAGAARAVAWIDQDTPHIFKFEDPLT